MECLYALVHLHGGVNEPITLVNIINVEIKARNTLFVLSHVHTSKDGVPLSVVNNVSLWMF